MIGRSLAHYRILEKLGAGGMGEVYLAEDTRLERRVALKILAPGVAGDPQHLARFRREAKAVAAVNHPNIVTVYAVEEEQGLHFFTMEHVDGGTLGARSAAGMALSEVVAWSIPLADALAAAHEAGIVHRDLKPSNVMMNGRGEVKILDFGLAKRVDVAAAAGAEALTVGGALVGTVAYMAPEQIRGARIDARADLFAVGVLIYEMATGRHPFHRGDMGDLITAILHDQPPPLAEIRPEAGVGLAPIVARCLAKDPGDRYRTAAELRQALIALSPSSGEVGLTSPTRIPAPGNRRAGTRPDVWNLPHLRNLNFIGRDREIGELCRLLDTAVDALPLVAVVGLGGVGKTQLVVEYAHRSAAEHRVVWWVPSAEPAGLRSRYAALARELGLATHQDVDRTVVRVRDWLEANPGWLLVFDNAEEPAGIRPYLPPGGAGRVLVTSRNPAWRGLGRVLGLDVWAPESGAAFLERRTGHGDTAAAHELNQTLGGLPLALEQAAAYIEASGQSLAAYTRLFREQRMRLLEVETTGSATSTSSVIATWDLSFRQVARSSEAAQQLLHICAFLAPDDIPLDLLRESRDLLPEALGEAAADQLALDDALAALLRFSLISRVEDSLSVHRLVQAVVRQSLGPAAPVWAEKVLRLVSRVFPKDGFREVGVWPRCSRLLPHALACLGWRGDEPPRAAAGLLDSVGSYLDGRGQYQEARSCLERALAIEEAARGPDHPKVAKRANNLGRVLASLGEFEQALGLFGRALAIDEGALGPNHPQVARRLSNVGAALMNLGKWDEAESYLDRALRIDEVTFGPDHPRVAMRLINLGVMSWKKGALPAAKDYFERALHIDETAVGSHHPRVAMTTGNLGAVHNELGEVAVAKELHQRSLAIFERAYGPEHPSLALPLRNLGEVLHSLGRQRSARAHLDRALEIERAALGESHPGQAETLELLGVLAKDQGRPSEARDRFESSLEIFEEYLGPDHPDTVRVSARLKELEAR